VQAGQHDPFESWFEALEGRCLHGLSFAEVRRALQALSSLYVERRCHAGGPARALQGAGKRAAFALFYAPLHFLLVRQIVRSVGAASPPPETILDLGCGTGCAGAAWALECIGETGGVSPPSSRAPRLVGIDRNAWAVGETRWTLRTLGLKGAVRRGNLEGTPLPGSGTAVLLAFTANELAPAARERLLGRLLKAHGHGASVLVVEPVARRVAPWWGEWSRAAAAAGGLSGLWRFPARLPERLRLLDRAAGLDHSELTGRSLWLPPRSASHGPSMGQDRKAVVRLQFLASGGHLPAGPGEGAHRGQGRAAGLAEAGDGSRLRTGKAPQPLQLPARVAHQKAELPEHLLLDRIRGSRRDLGQ